MIALLTFAKDAVKAAYNIYSAVNDARGLPKRFRAAADQIPLVLETLQLAEKNVKNHEVDQTELQNATPVLEQCRTSAETIKEIFNKSLTDENGDQSRKSRESRSPPFCKYERGESESAWKPCSRA